MARDAVQDRQDGRDAPGEPGQTVPQKTLAGGIVCVATPLGNLGDITLRGKQVLAGAACGLRGHADDARAAAPARYRRRCSSPCAAQRAKPSSGVVSRIAAGDAVAYVGDAGSAGDFDPVRDWSLLSARCGFRQFRFRA